MIEKRKLTYFFKYKTWSERWIFLDWLSL